MVVMNGAAAYKVHCSELQFVLLLCSQCCVCCLLQMTIIAAAEVCAFAAAVIRSLLCMLVATNDCDCCCNLCKRCHMLESLVISASAIYCKVNLRCKCATVGSRSQWLFLMIHPMPPH